MQPTSDLTPSTPAPRKPRRWPIYVTIGVVAFLAIGAIGSAQSDDDTGSDTPAAAADAPSSTTQAPATTTTLPPAPTPADYTITLTTQRQACFGSAGCNVTVVPELAIVGPNALDQAVSITFEVGGAQDVYVDTISVDSGGSYTQRPVVLSTASADVVLTASITAVS